MSQPLRRALVPYFVPCVVGALASCSSPEHPVVPSLGVADAGIAAPSTAPPPHPPPNPTVPAYAPREVEAPALTGMFAIEGALIVSDGIRAGRLNGTSIEWLGAIPKVTLGFGANQIRGAYGRWPDRVGVTFTSLNGRAPFPWYQPLVGKGRHYELAPSGQGVWPVGVVRLSDTTLVVSVSTVGEVKMMPVEGPVLMRRPRSPKQAGCTRPGEYVPLDYQAAVVPEAIETSRLGAMVSIGPLCTKGVAAEIWNAEGASRIVSLDRHWSDAAGARLLKGAGDTLYATRDPFSPILQFERGEVRALLAPPVAPVFAFVSDEGMLHISDGRTLHRWADGRWDVVAAFSLPPQTQVLQRNDTGLWALAGKKLYALAVSGSAPAEARCSTPFVYLYDASPRNPRNYDYPTTRKALAGFAPRDGFSLVEFALHDERRRLGVRAPTQNVAHALAAHMRTQMPGERPVVTCLAPETARVIPLEGKQ